MFHSKSSETALQKDIEWARQRRADLEEIADHLLELIDFTPNDEADRKGLLKELRLEKKELQLQKREVAAEMKAVRTEARQAAARIEPIPLRGFSKYSAIDRRRIRREKESLLKPAENAKAALDRQLVAIDRRINWLERFGE
jgi:nucleoid DNA-binding protein